MRGKNLVIKSDIIKASTMQKSGQRVPKGPKAVCFNEKVEK